MLNMCCRAACSHSFCGQCRLQLLPANRSMFLCPMDGIESWAEKMYKDLNVWATVKDFRYAYYILCSVVTRCLALDVAKHLIIFYFVTHSWKCLVSEYTKTTARIADQNRIFLVYGNLKIQLTFVGCNECSNMIISKSNFHCAIHIYPSAALDCRSFL